MDITYGCVFIEIAKKNGINSYDWVNKQVFPLSSDSLDSLIYVLSKKEPYSFANKNTSEFMFTLSSKGNWSVTKDLDIIVKDNIQDYQIYGLRILLEQAKIKIHGWD